MADDKETPAQAAPTPALPAFPGQEEDVLFKAQMGIANAFYGYWKHGIALVVVVLLAVLAWGTWQNHVRDEQRATHAEISKITRTLQAGIQKHADDPDMLQAQAAEGARRLQAIAAEGSDPAATYALIRAAQAWRVADDPAQLLATWEQAHARGAKGELGWAAALGLSSARFDSGDVDGAIAVLEEWAGQRTTYDAQRARFEIARYQELAGRVDAAIQSYQAFSSTFPESPMSSEAAAAVGRLQSNG